MTIEIKKPIKRKRSSDDDSTTTMAIISSSSSHDDDYQEKENLGGYECRTCRKRFKSFQALGGHQGIHKKIKPFDDKFDECELRLDIVDPSKSFFVLHRCKQCAKEFDSGQALGGHMRRHRRKEAENIVSADDDDDDQQGKSDLTVLHEPAEQVSRRIKAAEQDQDGYEKRRRIMMRSELMLAAKEWRLSI